MNGFALHFWFRLLDQLFTKDLRSSKAVLLKCVADQIVYAPLSIVVFFSFARIQKRENINDTFESIRHKLTLSLVNTWLADCMIWPFANLINFRLIPINYRPTFVGFVQLFWITYLSYVGNE